MKQTALPFNLLLVLGLALSCSANLAATQCPASGSGNCVITITVIGCANNICTVSATPTDASVTPGTQVSWQLPQNVPGNFTIFFIPDLANTIYAPNLIPVFTGGAGSPTVPTAVMNSSSSTLYAKYLIAWSDSAHFNRGFVDPRVVVSGGVKPPLKKHAPRKKAQ